MKTQSLTDLEDERRALIAPLYSTAQMYDFIWMLFISMKVENTPMWTGWNSKLVDNKHPMQVIQYLPQIDASPTIDAVVVLTMEMSLRIAAEGEQKYTSLSSDTHILSLTVSFSIVLWKLFHLKEYVKNIVILITSRHYN